MKKTGIQEKSADTLILENRLRSTAIGDVVSYAELSLLVGRDVRQFCISNLRTARNTLIGESIFFDCVAKEGFKRLSNDEAATASDHYRTRIHSTALRCQKHLRNIQFNELSAEAKRKHQTVSAIAGATILFSSSRGAKKIESSVKESAPMAIGETLKLFGG